MDAPLPDDLRALAVPWLDPPDSSLLVSKSTLSWLLVLPKGIGGAVDGAVGWYRGGGSEDRGDAIVTGGAFSDWISPWATRGLTLPVSADALARIIDGGHWLLDDDPEDTSDRDRVADGRIAGTPGRMGPADGGGRRLVRARFGGTMGLG